MTTTTRPVYMSKLTIEGFQNFFRYFDGEPQQLEGTAELWKAMPVSLLEEDSEWIKAFRAKPEIIPSDEVLLDVPFDCQLTNPSGDGWRECCSSSCAMMAKYHLPSLEINDYHRRRPQFGDSTDPSAQIRCLNSFGLAAKFSQVGSVEKLKDVLRSKLPAALGFLHHGTPQNPSGGGHYLCAIGFDSEHLAAHDPYGEMSLTTGSYPNPGPGGKNVRYSWKNWAPRWSVSSDHDGWGILVTGKL